jgi:hypothetical protein
MALSDVVWVIDTSSICEIRRSTRVAVRKQTFIELTQRVNADRLKYPPEVVKELARHVDPKAPDDQYQWAQGNAAQAHVNCVCDFADVKAVLDEVQTVLDPDKDSGEDEADPYVLAAARKLRATGIDARVVTEEIRDYPSKMSMNTACGLLGIPCVHLKAFLAIESIPF